MTQRYDEINIYDAKVRKSLVMPKTVTITVEDETNLHFIAALLEHEVNIRVTPTGARSYSEKQEHKFREDVRVEVENVCAQLRGQA